MLELEDGSLRSGLSLKPGLYSFCDYMKTKLMDRAGIISVTLTFKATYIFFPVT